MVTRANVLKIIALVGAVVAAVLLIHQYRKFRPIDDVEAQAIDETKKVGQEVEILFAGQFEGTLEPCGCNKFQTGGVVNMAATLLAERTKAPDALVIGMPGIFGGQERLDRKKNLTVLRAIEAMGFDALAMGADELSFDVPLVERYWKLRTPLVSTNVTSAEAKLPTYVEREVKGLPVVLLSIPDNVPDEVRARLKLDVENPSLTLQKALASWKGKRALIVLVTGLPDAAAVKLARQFPDLDLVVLSNRQEDQPVTSLETTFFQKMPFLVQGKNCGRMTLTVDKDGKIVDRHTDAVTVRVGGQFPPVARELEAFYAEIAADPSYAQAVTPHCASCSAENAPGAAYVGAESCKKCHMNEYADWKSTKHAHAYITLANAQRQYYPECLNCHTTGMGRETGFVFAEGHKSPLIGVQCELCHGPSRAHTQQPAKSNTRKTPELTLCKECHTPERDPKFAGHEDEHLSRINHHQPANAEQDKTGPAGPYQDKLMLGRGFFKGGDYVSAAAAFAEAAAMRPDDPEPIAERGRSLVQPGAGGMEARKEGVAVLESVTTKYADYAKGHYYYGAFLLGEEGRQAEALVHYLRAEELGMKDEQFLYDLAHAHLSNRGSAGKDKTKQLALAVEYFKKAKDAGHILKPTDNHGKWDFLPELEAVLQRDRELEASKGKATEPAHFDAALTAKRRK